MSRQPVLFVSHGAPDVLLNPGAAVHMWETLGADLLVPRNGSTIVSTQTILLSTRKENPLLC